MASGQTIIIYGQLTFFNVLTKHINQEIMWDDSGTDAIGYKFTVAAVGYVHGLPHATTGVIPTTGNFDASDNMGQIRYLLGPRQHFEMRLGVMLDAFGNFASPGTPLIYCDPANHQGSRNVSLCDINNGPKAKALNVTRVASDTLLRVDLEFEICQTQCYATGTTDNQSGVLNNRWTVVDDIDESFFTTRTFTGKLRLSSSQVNPNNFRNLCVPPLQQGMRREHMQFAVSEDCLNLMYTVTDKEVAFAPPAPATSWHATFSQSIESWGQLGSYYDANITLGGDRNCDLKKLILIANSMAQSKFSNGLKTGRLVADKHYVVMAIEVIEEYTNDKAFIHFHARAKRLNFADAGMEGLATQNMGVPLSGSDISDVVNDYDYRFSRGARPGENLEVAGPISLVGAFASFLQNGCGIDFRILLGIPAEEQGPPDGSGNTTVSAVTTDDIPDDETISTVYSDANDDGMYTYNTIQDDEDADTGAVQMPIGVDDPGSDPGYIPGGPQAQNPTSVAVTVMPPSSAHITTVDQERVEKLPAVPKIATSPGITVTRVQRKTLSASATADGKKLYRTKTIIWWFDATRPNLPTDNVGNVFRRLPITFVDTDVIGPNSATGPAYKGGF